MIVNCQPILRMLFNFFIPFKLFFSCWFFQVNEQRIVTGRQVWTISRVLAFHLSPVKIAVRPGVVMEKDDISNEHTTGGFCQLSTDNRVSHLLFIDHSYWRNQWVKLHVRPPWASIMSFVFVFFSPTLQFFSLHIH